jgi:hypothetical protein
MASPAGKVYDSVRSENSHEISQRSIRESLASLPPYFREAVGKHFFSRFPKTGKHFSSLN